MKPTITGALTALALTASTLSAVATEQPGVRRTVFVTNKVENRLCRERQN
jgi:hypothetical protein